MRTVKIAYYLLFIVGACYPKNKEHIDKEAVVKNKIVEENGGNNPHEENTKLKIKENTLSEPLLTKMELQGIWGGDPNENAMFYIKGDTFYYVSEPLSGYYYEIEGNNILVDIGESYPNTVEVLSYYNDTLVIDELGYYDTLIKRYPASE